LVNNAGIYIRKRIEETTEDDLDQIMAVNIKGVFLGTKHALPAMRRAGSGSIINISSVAGLVGNPHGSPAYTATKGAVRLFTKATAVQHARDNIRCNSVHPGPIETEMLKEAGRKRIASVSRWVALGQRRISPMGCCISRQTNRPSSLAANW
jgi:NAD(P)-dependent dehydrogenase (short-subunit alcohol dehydrogenase family)